MSIFDNLGGYSGWMVSWLTSTAFWLFVMLIILGAFFGMLIIRKRRKFNKVVLELIDLGDGRFDFLITKGGWFKSKVTFFKLYDYGSEDRFKLKDGTIVDNVSQNDYRRILGKLGLVIVRNPNDPKIAFPVSRFWLSERSKQMMTEVAPADYRDSAEKCIEQVDLEMQSKWQQYAPLIIIGVVVMITLIITILNTQYGKYMVDKAVQTIAEIKSTPCAVIPSPIAP